MSGSKPWSRMLPLMTAVAGILALAGCSGPDVPPDVDPQQLVGTWTIDATFDSPEQPFIDFVEGGTWTASDGCNRVQGTWELGPAGELTTTSGPSTLMACAGAQLPLAVTLADYVVISGDILSIHSSAESTVTDLVRGEDPGIGSLGLAVGQWTASDAAGAPMLSLAVDGAFSGDDGCNVLSGTWLLDDDGTIMFEQMASTLRYCEGVDTWLSKAEHATVEGDTMTIEDADGQLIGELTRS